MTKDLESRFHDAMLQIYHDAAELGYRPSYFLKMVQTKGGLQTAKDLIEAEAPSSGFTRLWELDRLDISVEAIALRPEFRTLFTDEQMTRAERRLAEYDYKADGT